MFLSGMVKVVSKHQCDAVHIRGQPKVLLIFGAVIQRVLHRVVVHYHRKLKHQEIGVSSELTQIFKVKVLQDIKS
jgi:hypothetical protein